MSLFDALDHPFDPVKKIPVPVAKEKIPVANDVQEISSCEPEENLNDSKVCPGCQESGWWTSCYDNEPRCENCQPFSSLSLVGSLYFFDDRGDRWNVSFDDDCEYFSKAII